jgi:hypothetical protein
LIRRLALGALLVASGAVGAAAQDTIHLRDPGPRGGPPSLVQALGSPYIVIRPADAPALLSRNTPYSRTVVVLGRDAVVEGTVRGDVIIIGGDLYVHPGADVRGRAIAIGGGVYESTVGHIAGEVQAHREFTYDITQIAGGWALSYRAIEPEEEPRTVAEMIGLVVPTYDRSNGLSLAVAPWLSLPHTGVRFQPRVTYRSQLGRLDPFVAIVDSLDRRTALQVSAGRSTFSNDAWIMGDLVNSLQVLWRGEDSRNYFRATRGDVTLSRRWTSSTTSLVPYVGTRFENASSVRPGLNPTSGPWSFSSRKDPDDMFRPNPPVDPGITASFLTGIALNWVTSDITARLRIDEELGSFSENCGGSCDLQTGTDFAQTTFDGRITFPTFGTQRVRVDGHAVITSHGDDTPPQRFAYIGGLGSIPTIEMLSRGGDQLLYLDAYYEIPIDRVTLPLIGAPVVTLREILGGADVRRFPTLDQATGVRLSIGYVYVEALVDPVRHHGHALYGLAIAR